jgi:hypothetical protein
MKYENVKSELKKGASYVYHKTHQSDPKKLFKVVAIIGGIVTLLVLFFSFGKAAKAAIFRLFGRNPDGSVIPEGDKTAGAFDFGSDNGRNISLNSTAGGSYQGNTINGNKPNPSSMQGNNVAPLAVRNLVDLIWEKLNGPNVMVYPDVVNRLANLSLSDLKKACLYYGDKYKAAAGNKNFYQFIASEWNAGGFYGVYKPALAALKKTGFYGK